MNGYRIHICGTATCQKDQIHSVNLPFPHVKSGKYIFKNSIHSGTVQKDIHKAFLAPCKQTVKLQKCRMKQHAQSQFSSNYWGWLCLLSPGDVTKETGKDTLHLFVAKNITRGGGSSGGDVKIHSYWTYVHPF